MDIFRKIFGLNHNEEEHYNQYRRNVKRNDLNEPDQPDIFDRKGFDVFTDPLQMHQYFEHQMNEVLKRFGFQEFGQFSTFDSPSIDINPFENDGKSQDIRDQYLKPGYVKPKTQSDMVDKDLDDKVKTGDLDSLLSEKYENQISPYKPPSSRNYYSHGSTQSIKSITKPDGSIETHRTVRDSQGNEETCVCHKLGDKEYCIIKKKDKTGNEETTEQLVNMTDDEKDIFFKSKIPNLKSTDENSDFRIPWDKFFK